MRSIAERQAQVDRGAKQRDTSAESSFRFDYARRAMRQTSLIVDPPDGRLPAIKPAVQGRIMPRGTYGPGPLNSWEDFSLYERCITRGIAGSILRVIYGNGNRIVQAPGVVALSYEMLPDTRLFYTDGRAHIGASIGEYLGDSRARWEGEELVVETTNLTDKTAIGVNGNGIRHSKEMVITERFRRIADNMVQYQATYDNPVTYEKPFTVSFPLTPLDGGMLLPYDCHPGNTAISMSLRRRTIGRASRGGGLRERHHPSKALRYRTMARASVRQRRRVDVVAAQVRLLLRQVRQRVREIRKNKRGRRGVYEAERCPVTFIHSVEHCCVRADRIAARREPAVDSGSWLQGTHRDVQGAAAGSGRARWRTGWASGRWTRCSRGAGDVPAAASRVHRHRDPRRHRGGAEVDQGVGGQRQQR